MNSQSFKTFMYETEDAIQKYMDKASVLAQGANKVIIVLSHKWPKPYIVANPDGSVRNFRSMDDVRSFASRDIAIHADYYTPKEIEELSLKV